MAYDMTPDDADAVSFRPLRRIDFPLVAAWFGRDHVAGTEWGEHEPTIAAVESEFGAAVDSTEPTDAHIVELADRPIGLIQRYVIGDYPEWLADLEPAGTQGADIGIDYLLGEEDATGHGVGTRMIGAYVAKAWIDHPEAPAITVGVLEDNPGSRRILEKNGFTQTWSGVLLSDGAVESRSVVYRLDRGRQATQRSRV